MLVEAAAAALLVVATPDDVPRWWAIVGLALVAVVWVSTAWFQVPRHRQLGGGFDDRVWRALVATNWLRTLAWTGRGLLALAMLARSAT